MKNSVLLFLFFLLSINAFSLDKISYTYDNAGNRISRKYVVSLQNPIATPKKQLDSTEVVAEIGVIDVTVYPNPTKGDLYVEVKGVDPKENISMKLYSPQGVNLKDIKSATEKTLIYMSSYSAGWYILRVKTGEKTVEFKIIKQ